MRALVTGSNGFVGRHLAAELRAQDADVWGVDCAIQAATDGNATFVLGDILDAAFLDGVLKQARPTHVFHVAGQVGSSESDREALFRANLDAAVSVAESMRQCAPGAWLLLASSSAVYGASSILPVAEDAPVRPTTAYGESKAAAEDAVRRIAGDAGIRVVVARTFNLIGPAMSRRLFAGSLAAQIAAAERGGEPQVKVGNLQGRRDYVDVRDAARAYVSLTACDAGTINVCSGVAHSSQELADEMCRLAAVPVTLDHDGSRVQAGDVDEQRGTFRRLAEATGWTPSIPFGQSVRDVLEHERRAAASSARERGEA